MKLKSANLSTAVQIWVIGALVPLALILTRKVGAYDFSAFWFAGRLILNGEPALVYSSTASLEFAKQWSLGGAAIFPYPPHALLIFLPFALIAYLPAYLAWNIVTAAFFFWAARAYIPKGMPTFLSICTPAALICYNFGQTGLFFGALWLLAFSGKWPAVALLTFKPHLGLLSALSLRSRRELLNTILFTAALIIICLIVFGQALWLSFFEQSLTHVDRISSTKRWLFAGVTPAIGYGAWGWIAFAIVGSMLLLEKVNAFTAATASFLIAPYGFHYDMPVVCLGFGLLIAKYWDEMTILHRIPILIGFLSPVIALSGNWWMPPLLAWALWAQTKYDYGPEHPNILLRIPKMSRSPGPAE